MSKIDDGGPAAPVPLFDEDLDLVGSTRGMSLRDWFAGQALAAIVAKQPTEMVEAYEPLDFEMTVAHGAYGYADAMLAARAAKKEAAQ